MNIDLPGPSRHLSWIELACHDGTVYPFEWRHSRAIQLAEVFELIRRSCGNSPIKVLSGYRTTRYNELVGGARLSQHIQGRAIDLKPPKGLTVEQFHRIIFELSKNSFIKGIGKYKTFVHVDVRPGTHLALWNGVGVLNG